MERFPQADAVAAVLREAFSRAIARSDIDVVERAEDPGVVEVMADAWTLHIEVEPVALAWLALDTEPESPARARFEREAVMLERDLAALIVADAALGGALRGALRVSADPLSLDLAEAIDEKEVKA